MDNKEKIIEQIDSYYDSWFKMNSIYHDWAKRHSIDDTMLFVLYVIKNSVPYCTQNQICNKLFLPKQTVSQILSKLEKQGYIEKEIKAEDRRNKIITFTEKGNCFAIPILEKLKLAEIEAFSGISYTHRVNIIENLAVLIHALSKKFK